MRYRGAVPADAEEAPNSNLGEERPRLHHASHASAATQCQAWVQESVEVASLARLSSASTPHALNPPPQSTAHPRATHTRQLSRAHTPRSIRSSRTPASLSAQEQSLRSCAPKAKQASCQIVSQGTTGSCPCHRSTRRSVNRPAGAADVEDKAATAVTQVGQRLLPARDHQRP